MKKQKRIVGAWNENRGITLIALIITIIVLLILAGVTINLALGENGIIRTAERAAKNYTNAQEKELADTNEFTNTLNQTIQSISGENAGGDSTQNNPTLVSQIISTDYGKTINYSVTVNGKELSDWKVFYNDGTNVYIILSEYLDNTLIPTLTGMTTIGKYQAYWESSSNTEAIATLTSTSNWSAFAEGNGGFSAIGSPTSEMFVASWNANPNTNETTLIAGTTAGMGKNLTDSTGLYFPHTSAYEGCSGYWLASPSVSSGTILVVVYDGRVVSTVSNMNLQGLRPVVCLQSSVTGMVGDTVIIDK